MSTRKERAERANRSLLRCRGCGGWRVGPHFDPWTKTYICRPADLPAGYRWATAEETENWETTPGRHHGEEDL